MAHSRAVLFSTISCLALIAGQAAAQQAGAPLVLDPIIVKGELVERSLQDTPTSVAVETGETLEKRGDQDIYDVIERVPNVTSSFGEQGFSIRGIDQRGVGGGNGLLVSTQVDGVALPSNQATFFGPYSNWDLEQVEVLRGPQSTQQGRNALAGAVVIRSKDPTFDREFKLRTDVGTANYRRFALAANTPLVDDRLAFRFSAEHFQHDGFVENPTRGEDDYDAHDSTTYRGKLLWTPNDRLRAVLTYSQTESSGGEDYIDTSFFPDRRVILSDEDGEEGSKHRNLGLRLNYELNDTWTLESETNFYRHDYRRFEDADNSAAALGSISATGESKVFEQDLRLAFDTGVVTGVAGLFYSDISNRRPAQFTADAGNVLFGVPNGLFVTRETFDPEDVQNIAIFGEAEIAADGLLSGLSFTLGARLDHEDYAFTNTTTYTPDVSAFGLSNTSFSGETSYTAFLPKAGVTYDFTEDQSISFTVQRGYRAGGAQVNAFTGGLNEFDPEFTTNYELAYRGSFLDGRLRTSGNLFYTRWKDQQVTVFGANGGSTDFDFDVVNAGESELFGIELTAEGEVTDRFTMYGSVGHTHTEFLDFQNGSNDFSGNEFPLAPSTTAAIGGEYSWDNGVSLGVDVSYTDGSFARPTNTDKSDDRWLVNTQLTYESAAGWETGLYVRNLFDKDYLTFNDVTNGGGRAGNPREVGFYVQKSF
ncbi:TonB-dependent receptor [Epibacterium sp. SM1979]|uniref:TonB-dependent receptor n=1 Tax=Tritonibacter litoralis TaxID=2662264 RepID=A0A843YKC2_9RHOB|nr:TonB-dependent receptor [Tritonibacter litoralis]MQQ09619.1 TonB-dependent receptor [Tritonibacter litoralis]